MLYSLSTRRAIWQTKTQQSRERGIRSDTRDRKMIQVTNRDARKAISAFVQSTQSTCVPTNALGLLKTARKCVPSGGRGMQRIANIISRLGWHGRKRTRFIGMPITNFRQWFEDAMNLLGVQLGTCASWLSKSTAASVLVATKQTLNSSPSTTLMVMATSIVKNLISAAGEVSITGSGAMGIRKATASCA